MNIRSTLLLPFLLFSMVVMSQEAKITLVVLGTVQDGGSPHIGCKKTCCAQLFERPDPERKVVSLGVIDHQSRKTFLFEATPDLPQQLKLLNTMAKTDVEVPTGIFITHAHIGH